MLSEKAQKYYIDESKQVSIISGELHYFRVLRKRWEPTLKYLKKVGFNFVTTYVPWIWHELDEGKFDFNGTTDEKRDLIAFIKYARDIGLYLILRPGPYINAEYDGYGIPHWVEEKYPQVVALNNKGKPIRGSFFFQPDPMHPDYLRLVKNWYAAFSKAISPYLDIIQAIQVDNESGVMNYLQLGYSDFNSHVVSEYQKWLAEKYGTVENLNKKWQKKITSFSNVFPPTGKFNFAESTDWQIFYENYLTAFLDTLRNYIKEFLPQMTVTHNIPGSYFSPTNARLFSSVSDIFGYDIYIKMSHAGYYADFPFFGSIIPELIRSKINRRGFWVPELGAGWFDPQTPVHNKTVIHTILASIAHDVNGFSLYTIHNGFEPDGSTYGYNALFNADGMPSQKHESISKIVSIIHNNSEILFNSKLIRNKIGFVVYDDLYRLDPTNFSSILGMPNLGRSFVFSINMGLLGPAALMLESGLQFEAISLENITNISTDEYKIVFFPSKGLIDPDHYKILKEFVRRGGTLVTYPIFPTMDLYGEEFDTTDLYPDPIIKEQWFGTKRMMLNIVKAIIKNRVKSSHHEYSKPLIDKISAVEGIMKSKVHGPYIKIKDIGILKSSMYLATFKTNEKVHGYISEFGNGKSIVIGTPIAAEYISAAYFYLTDRIRREFQLFLKKLLQIAQIETPIYDFNIEIARKKYDSQELVLLFNRTVQNRQIDLGKIISDTTAEILYADNNKLVSNHIIIPPFGSIILKI